MFKWLERYIDDRIAAKAADKFLEVSKEVSKFTLSQKLHIDERLNALTESLVTIDREHHNARVLQGTKADAHYRRMEELLEGEVLAINQLCSLVAEARLNKPVEKKRKRTTLVTK